MALDREHGVVDQLADGRLLCIGLKVRPAGVLRDPEDVFGEVFVGVFCGVRIIGEQGRAFGLESVGDVLQEDQAESNVLVVGWLQVAAELVGGKEELRLKAEVSAVAVLG